MDHDGAPPTNIKHCWILLECNWLADTPEINGMVMNGMGVLWGIGGIWGAAKQIHQVSMLAEVLAWMMLEGPR